MRVAYHCPEDFFSMVSDMVKPLSFVKTDAYVSIGLSDLKSKDKNRKSALFY